MSAGGWTTLLSVPVTSPAHPAVALTTVLVPRPSSPKSVVTTVGTTIVQIPGTAGPSFSATWLAPLITLAVGVYAAYLLRRTGKGTVAAAQDSAKAAEASARTSRRAEGQLDTWRQREETYRTLRWAADSAIKNDARSSSIGVAALIALFEGGLLQTADKDFVRAVMQAVIALPLVAPDDRPEYFVDTGLM